MKRPRLLVITTVHRPDDPRIREKLIETLRTEWDVTYASRQPGPSDSSGFSVLALSGGRLARILAAARLIMQRRWELVALHDPELLPIGLARAWAGRATLFDLHENLPDSLRERRRFPDPVAILASTAARILLRLAESSMSITIAEASYARWFEGSPPVIANLLPSRVPRPARASAPGHLAYLGDITEARGAFLAIEAAAGARMDLVMVGRVVPESLGEELHTAASARGVDLELVGQLPHHAAMERIVGAVAGVCPLSDVANYRWSLPTKVLEYLALGLPVLASDLPGTKVPLSGMEAVVLVPADDVGAWRRAGEDLRHSHELRDMAAAQADEVLARFSWDREAVLSAYRSALPGETRFPS